MNSSSRTTLLVALSEGFGLSHFFSEKLDQLVGTLSDFDILLVQDTQRIAQDYFTARGIPFRDERVPTRMAAKNLVNSSTHVIVFWGGDDLVDIVYFANLLRKKFRVIPLRLTTVRNKDSGQEFDINIGRSSPWGNPFRIGHGPGGDSREEVIEKFKKHFVEEVLSNPDKHKALLSLRGYRLGCHCKPLACHGDVIAAYLNSYEDDVDMTPDNA
jgi:hypothetical protein